MIKALAMYALTLAILLVIVAAPIKEGRAFALLVLLLCLVAILWPD